MYPYNYPVWSGYNPRISRPFRYPQGTPNHHYCQPAPQPQIHQQRYPRTSTYLSPWSTERVTLLGPPAPAVNSTASTAAPSDKFETVLDVEHFQPEEITVTVLGGHSVNVECKHQGKQEHLASVSRHFSTRILLPQSYDMAKMECYMSSDGFLTLAAPKTSAGDVGGGDGPVPIVQSGGRLNPVD